MIPEIRAMILSAGFGSRMEKAGEKRPKPLVKVCEKPLIFYPLFLLAGAGFKEVVINLHHRAEEIRKEIGEQILGMKIRYILEPEILGTGGGIKNAQEKFPSQLWLTLNADTIIDLDLRELISFHQKHNPLATMVLTKCQLGEFNPVYADDTGRVQWIGALPPPVSSSQNLIAYNYCGVQLLKSELLDYLPQGFSKIIEHGYQKALEKKELILGYIFSKLWLTIDSPEARQKAEQELSSSPKFLFSSQSGKSF